LPRSGAGGPWLDRTRRAAEQEVEGATEGRAMAGESARNRTEGKHHDEGRELRGARPSLMLRVLVWLFKRAPSIFPREAHEVSAFLDARPAPRRAPLPRSFERRFGIEHRDLEGQRCVTLHPKSGPGAKHILYFHGGGFVLPNVKQHWDLMGALVEASGASVTAALYDLVPENPAANADRLADAAFEHLCTLWRPEDIALCGDSAGGHMALSLALRRVRAGKPGPGRLVLYAPWLDITMRDERAREVEPRDFMLAVEPLRELGKVWAEDRDPSSAECSPLYAPRDELAQLPPTRIFTGRDDIFIVDSRSFLARLRAAGVDARLCEYEGAPHVFMALTASREAKDCIALTSRFINDASE